MDFSIDTAFDCPSALEQTKEEHKEVEIKPVKSDLAHKGMSRITSDPIIDFQGLLATTLDLQFVSLSSFLCFCPSRSIQGIHPQNQWLQEL